VANRDPAQADLSKQLDTIQKVINEAQAEMRALLLHLRPTNLEGKSLKQGIIQLLKELQTKITIEITWQLDDIKLNPAAEDNLFRIVQELLSNTLRHAKASSLEVYLKQLQDMVVLRMVDDGVGFDAKQASSNGNYGLANIKERAAAMGGTAKVVSVVGQGTSVEVRVPLSKDVAHD
jgi:two-component system, NarL family, sensor histidine kinase LiaS